MKITYSKRAVAQLDEVFAYIARDNPTAAASVVDRIESCARFLREYPEMGRMTDREGVRFLVVTPYPYLLFYRVLSGRGEVRILSIGHGARRR